MGFATSRVEGRHLVRYRAITVNGRLVDIPSYPVKVGDVIQVAQGANGRTAQVKHNLEQTKDRPIPPWIQVDPQHFKGLIVRLPQKEDMGLAIQEQLIVELYSK
jgi:small subunit ribosomal protein S4